MKTETSRLLHDLKERTLFCQRKGLAFKQLSSQALNARPAAESWSVLECLEHLNRFGRFYIPEFRQRISNSRYPASSQYKSSLLGNWFARSVEPGSKPIPTMASMNPAGSQLQPQLLDEFLEQQEQLMELLEQASQVNLNKTKASISVSKMIRLRLGDMLRVVVYHNQRHVQQAERALAAYEAKS